MEDVKRCARCRETKPLAAFYRNAARADGVSGYCKGCMDTIASVRAQRLRSEVIDLLGGPVCKRCGFDDPRALVIDHLNGGGNRHRRQAVSLWQVLKHARAYPSEYQVLCCNCNQIKRHEEGEWASAEYLQRVSTLDRERIETPKRWARKYDSCQGCGTTDRPHSSKGLCHNCLMRLRRRGTTERVEDVSGLRSEQMKARWADPAGRERLLASKGLSRGQ